MNTRRAQAAGIVTKHVLAGIVLSLIGSWGFAALWDAVKDRGRDTMQFDRTVLVWMHTHQLPWLLPVVRILARIGSPPVIVGIAVMAALAGLIWRQVRGAAWTLPLAVLGAGAIIQGIKVTFHRPRPAFFTPLLRETGYSFPSGHSLISIVVYGLLGYFALSLFRRRAGRVFVGAITVMLVLLIGLSRVYAGVHYPTDVLAGWTAGLPWLIACLGLHEVLSRRFRKAGEPVLEEESSVYDRTR